MKKNIIYKGFEIDCTTYDYISVFYQGDDVFFQTVGAAKEFIDRITAEDQEAIQ